MESVEKPGSVRFALPVFTALEWLLVLPAALFLFAAAFRGLQPQQFEPARTCAAIVAWTVAHVSRLGATFLFLGMPGAVMLAGGGTLLRIWRKDSTLRQDSATTFAILRRHLAVGLLTAAVLLAGAVLAAVAVHNITD
ncbi:MAG TPA: hypothetical protein VE263_16025 [Candidatus Angelobacter sp.]|nr:hypothetical protein [Candidatus Angelobacter sp.]